MAIVREWDRDVGLDASLKELEWLIGTWQAATKDRDVTITYEWDENKAGVIRGNYDSVLSDTTLPVYGSVDKKTQRAAWTVRDR